MAAILGRQPSAFDYLLNEVKVDVNVVEKSNDTTAVHIAAIMASKWEPAVTHCLFKLIACNAEMDCVDSYGQTVWNYVPENLRERVAKEFEKHKLNQTQVILHALGPSTIPVGPLMDIVVGYLNFTTINWGPFPDYEI